MNFVAFFKTLTLCTIICCDAWGQESSIDSLLQQLKKPLIQDTSKVKTLNKLSSLYARVKPEEGLKYGEQALQLAKEINYQKGHAIALTEIGENFMGLFDFNTAIDNYLIALEIYQQLENKIDQAKLLAQISRAYGLNGNYDSSIDYAHLSLAICKELESVQIKVSNWIAIGEVNFRRENFNEALICFDKALTLSIQRDHQPGQSESHFHLSQVYRILENYDSAEYHATNALEIDKNLGNKYGTSTDLSLLGNLYLDQGDFVMAMSHYVESKDLNIELNDTYGQAGNLMSMGDIYYYFAHYNKAHNYYDSALAIAKKNQVFLRAEVMEAKAVSYIEQENYKEAIKYLSKVLDFYSDTEDMTGFVGVLSRLAYAYSELQEFDRANNYLQRSLKISNELELNSGNSRTYSLLASIYFKMNKYDSAIHYGKKALLLGDSLDGLPVIGPVTEILYKAYFKKNEFEQGLTLLNRHLEIKDSIYSIEKALAVQSQEFEHQLDAKTKENSRLVQESKLSKNELEHRKSTIIYMLVFVVLSIALILLLYRLFIMKKRAVRSISVSHDLMKKQKEEIRLINTNLESLVEQRTAKIQRQNERFVKFAFHNAHIVRGPLSRLMGLLNLFSNDMLEEKERKEYLGSMILTAQELDNVVSKINNVLTKGQNSPNDKE